MGIQVTLSGKLFLKEFICALFPMPESGAEKWQFEWLDLGAVENSIIWTRGENWVTIPEFCPQELGYGFRKCEIVTKIAGALTASIAGLFILICVSCALCWLRQAMSLFFTPSPHPPSWEERVVFSHLNYVFSCILSARCCLCKEWGKQNWNRGLHHTACHSKFCIAALREGRRIQNSSGHTINFQILIPG